MQIETYEIERESSEISQLAADGEAMMLIEKLGLEGQRKTFAKDGTQMPYRPMTKQEAAVFGIMFPRRTEVTAFSDGPIPVRVLQVISHVRELDLPELRYIEVWHAESAKDDPVLVARSAQYSYGGTNYLLARWGDALLPLEELTKKAIEKASASATLALKAAAREVAMALELVEDKVRDGILSGEPYTPHCHV